MLAPDTYLGPYRLIARIGAGGMGEVWKGEDTRLGRTVAIKVLPPSVAADHEGTARPAPPPPKPPHNPREGEGGRPFFLGEGVGGGGAAVKDHQARRALRGGA